MKQFHNENWDGISRKNANISEAAAQSYSTDYARRKAAEAAFYDAIKVEDAAVAAEDAARVASRVAYQAAMDVAPRPFSIATSKPATRTAYKAADAAERAFFDAAKAKDAASKRLAAAFAAYKAAS